jgi:glycosyltransferase involved in cell wall biosynthesis
MTEKIKILTISDNPMAPSGVAHQTRNMIEGLLKTGKYKFFSFAGAMQHQNYEPFSLEEYGEDWIIQPVDGFGNDQQIRSIMRTEKPDILWFMTDPRFYEWLWALENEIRPNVPMVYYHVWDNYPYPTYNKKYYDSNDFIATISKVTDDVVKNVSPDVQSKRIAHAVDTDVFKKLKKSELSGPIPDSIPKDKFVFFWNNRNARRKQSGTLIFWFKELLEKVGDKAILIMHTEPNDPNGQPLPHIINHLGLEGKVFLSTRKLPPDELVKFYNCADCTINISDAEGFGLTTLESLSCETPILVTMTGGLQEQVTNEKDKWFGIGVEPSSKTIIGSLQVPWIYEDRISKEQFIDACETMINSSKSSRRKMGKEGRQHVIENYGLDKYVDTWDETLQEIHETNGSWENRKNYKNWKLLEV